ncbi:MAG: DUF4116 domain-containing protein [Candidatus Margulisbacteria bacterium]|jgi:hypothetical protein|nr:DUF4116 domain-containing protein [Candidatus Margulisiibacteriota bacterium]
MQTKQIAEVLERIEKNPHGLDAFFGIQEYPESKEIALAAVKLSPRFFNRINIKFQNDEDIISAVLEGISRDQLNDRRIIINLIRDTSNELCDNKNFMLPIVEKYPHFIEYAGEHLRNDKYFVLPIVDENTYLFKYVGEHLHDDKDFMLPIVKVFPVLLEYASERLRDDEDFMLPFIEKNPWLVKYAGKQLRNNLVLCE